MKTALLEAYRADDRELTRRMRAMRKTIIQHDVAAWANAFLEELAAERTHAKAVRPVRSVTAPS